MNTTQTTLLHFKTLLLRDGRGRSGSGFDRFVRVGPGRRGLRFGPDDEQCCDEGDDSSPREGPQVLPVFPNLHGKILLKV